MYIFFFLFAELIFFCTQLYDKNSRTQVPQKGKMNQKFIQENVSKNLCMKFGENESISHFHVCVVVNFTSKKG